MPHSPDPNAAAADERWLADWLDAVVSGKATMSQRARSSIDRHGGIDRAVEAAQAAGIHLLALTDDAGKPIVAASRHPFVTLC